MGSKKEADLLNAMREEERAKEMEASDDTVPVLDDDFIEHTDDALMQAYLETMVEGDWTNYFSPAELDPAHAALDKQATVVLNCLQSQVINKTRVPNNSLLDNSALLETLDSYDDIQHMWSMDFTSLKDAEEVSESTSAPLASLGPHLLPNTAPLANLADRTWLNPDQVLQDTMALAASSSTSPLDELSVIVQSFGLNQEQMTALQLVNNRLHSLLFPTGEDSDSLRLFISGAGGTDKSHLIHCIKYLFKFRDVSKKLCLLAPTGVAAYNIDAATVHTKFSLWNGDQMPDLTPSFKSNMSKKFAGIDFILIDEISMLSPKILHFMDLLFKSIYVKNKPFGA